MIEYLNLAFMQIYVFFAYGEIQGIISMNMVTLHTLHYKAGTSVERCAMDLPAVFVYRQVWDLRTSSNFI